MGVVVQPFRLRNLSGEAGREEVAAEVEAEGGRGEGLLGWRVDGFLLRFGIDGSHPGHGGGVRRQGGEIFRVERGKEVGV